jgi:hypothetical protein
VKAINPHSNELLLTELALRTCHISDDYVELRRGALDEFKSQLEGRYGELEDLATLDDPAGPSTSKQNSTLVSLLKDVWTSISRSAGHKRSKLPTYNK